MCHYVPLSKFLPRRYETNLSMDRASSSFGTVSETDKETSMRNGPETLRNGRSIKRHCRCFPTLDTLVCSLLRSSTLLLRKHKDTSMSNGPKTLRNGCCFPGLTPRWFFILYNSFRVLVGLIISNEREIESYSIANKKAKSNQRSP